MGYFDWATIKSTVGAWYDTSARTITNKTISRTSNTIGPMVDVQVFTPLGANYITNKQVVSNVVTLTTLTDHGYAVGDKVMIDGVDATIQTNLVSPVTITATPTSTTFTFARTTADLASTPVLPYGNVFKYQNWTKPAGATLVKFTLCGPGGGGGSGARQATTSNRTGGGGGGGGGWQEVTMPASQIPETPIYIIVPNGGYGGLPITTDNTVGMNGARGGGGGAATRICNTEVAYTASEVSLGAGSGYGGTGGGTGTTAAGGSGAINTQYNGGAGGAGNTTTGSQATNATLVGAGGGGGGGAAANSTTTAAGGNTATIVTVRSLSPTFVTPGNGTTQMNSTTNTDYYPVKAGFPGIGGGGGAYKTATNGGNGGNATNYCAGGGGGGASDNGYTSGAGGIGADGCVVITTYF